MADGELQKRMKEEYYAVGGEYNRRVDDAIPKSAALRMVEEAKKEFPWQYWAGAWVWDSEKPVSDVIKWFEKWFGGETNISNPEEAREDG